MLFVVRCVGWCVLREVRCVLRVDCSLAGAVCCMVPIVCVFVAVGWS